MNTHRPGAARRGLTAGATPALVATRPLRGGIARRSAVRRVMRPVLLLAPVLCLLAGCIHGPLPGPAPHTAGTTPAAAIAYPVPGNRPPAPADDVFYRQPAAVRLAALAPGAIIRYRPIVARAYRISHVRARGWQLVYRSTDTQGQPVADVATVLVPPRPRRRLLSYQVAYDALDPICAPSQEILRGTMIEQWFVSKALREGWPVVLPDHEGPDLAYLAGPNAGRAVLDGIRAAERFLPDTLVDRHTPVALWGYSGGAFASLWAGQMAATHAPHLPIVGIAAGGPPADLAAVARHVDGGGFAGVYFQAVVGLARAYPGIDLDQLLNARGQAMRARLAHSCVGQELAWVRDPLLSGLSFANMADYVRGDDLLARPAVRRIARHNSTGRDGLIAPLYYYQGWFDPLTPRAQARALARRYCDRHTPVRFDWVFGEHLLTAVTHGDDALAFLDARVAGQSAPDDCPNIERRGWGHPDAS